MHKSIYHHVHKKERKVGNDGQSNRPHVVAVCGKGGVGKTAFTALLTRELAGHPESGRLLVVDADPALGLAVALGLDVSKTIGEVRERVIKTAQTNDREEAEALADELDYLVLESLVETDTYAFLAMGRSEALGCFCSVNDLLRDAIELLSERFDTVIIDGEAGLEQINRQVLGELDCLLLLTDGSTRSLRTVELLQNIAEQNGIAAHEGIGVVFNKSILSEEEILDLSNASGLHVYGVIPADDEVAFHDATTQPLLLMSKESKAVQAVSGIAHRVVPNV
jgi:CO dehydrogenase maturation factor